MLVGSRIGRRAGKRPFHLFSTWEKYYPGLDEYKSLVLSEGGSIVDESALKEEITYIQENELGDKIGYLVSKDFGVKTGTEPLGRESFIAFSFDDGKSGDYDTYTRMAAKGTARGTSYINAKYIGTAGYLTWEQISEMYNDGWDFQCHSYSHAMDDTYGASSELWELTDAEVVAEIVNNNTAFTTNGLPLPVHHAFPRYIADNRVLELLSSYRKSFRGRNRDIDNYSTFSTYYGANWWGAEGYSVDYTSGASMILAKQYIDKAVSNKDCFHIHGHATEATNFPDLLDYCIAAGVEYGTVSQLYNKINVYRNRLFNLIKNDYGVLSVMDYDAKIGDYDGVVVFTDTLANIGATIADRYKDAGYNVMFWDDTADTAQEYAIPANTPYHDEVAVTANTDDRLIFAVNHGLTTENLFYLTGDVAPGGLAFDTLYAVQAKSGTTALYVKIPGGSRIDITSTGTNVKLSTYGYREALRTVYTGLDGVEGITKRVYGVNGGSRDFNLSYRGGTGTINNINIGLFKNLGKGSTAGMLLRDNMLTGEINDIIVNCQYITSLDLRNNYLEGGIDNICYLTNLTDLYLTRNLLTGAIPSAIGDLVNINLNIYLDNNQFSGTIPESIKNLILVTRFVFNTNQLSGYVKGTFNANMVNCIVVNLSSNAITTQSHIIDIIEDCSAMVTATSKALTLNVSGGTNASMADTNQGGIWGDFSGVAAPSDLAVALKNIDITKAGTVTLTDITAPGVSGDGTGFPAGFGNWWRA